jgi:sensor histidine kinase YesM
MYKAKKVYWISQIAGWLLLTALLFFASLLNPQSQNQKIEVLITLSCFFVFGVSITHLMRFSFLKLGWLSLKLSYLIPRVLFATILYAAIMSFLNDGAERLILKDTPEFTWGASLLNILVTSIFILLWNGVYFTFHFFQRSSEQEMHNFKLTASHNEIELKNLRSQLNPHFLFNSLNSIRALVEIEPVLAKDSITKLSNLLRKSLANNEQMGTFRDELSIINDYIDLEKVRFEERVIVNQTHDENLMDFKIPPFLLQTIVENSFKHGIAKRIKGGVIDFSSWQDQEYVYFSIQNDGVFEKTDENGVGVANTKRRLELQYNGKAKLELSEKNDKVIALIKIKKTTASN